MAGAMTLFTPLTVQNLTLANRITMAPLYLGYANRDGTVSELTREHYAAMARSGAALIVVENAAVHPTGLGSPLTLRIDSDNFAAGLASVAEIIHKEGALAFQQINHAGRYAFGTHKVAPSPVKAGDVVPKEMSPGDIAEIVQAFGEAAGRTKAAGFDGVELHGGTGYLLSQFLSPRTNVRSDVYGGTPQNRMRFLLEVFDAVREKVGSGYPIGYRFLADELMPGGLTIEETEKFALELAKKGVAYISVMVGTHESFQMSPYVDMEKKEGYMAEFAQRIKKIVPHIPVVTAGRIQSPETAEAILNEGKADMIGLARVLFADPLWPKKAQGLITEPIVPCTPACSLCSMRVMKGKPPFCSQWPKEVRDAFLLRIGEKEG
jgi:2,4-dienoyl-CoA reductase-like NADH-dependent reductase (Old Yellow Enzyme family)